MKPCMEPHEAAEWERLNMILPEKNRAAEPCEDCTIRFAVEMRLAGRCTGWPTVNLGGKPRSPRSPEERVEARRRTWRMSKARRRQAVA
jgi:hypothetical protein